MRVSPKIRLATASVPRPRRARARSTAPRRGAARAGRAVWASVRAPRSARRCWLAELLSRASTRFSKSLMRSNSRITLRTALCISRLSMSSVILHGRLAPLREFAPQVLGHVSDRLAVVVVAERSRRDSWRRALQRELRCVKLQTCARKRLRAAPQSHSSSATSAGAPRRARRASRCRRRSARRARQGRRHCRDACSSCARR